MDISSCGPCKRDTLQVPAAKWCRDCQEGLCDACLNYHRKIKHTMTHIVHDTLENEAQATLVTKFDDLLTPCPSCDEPRRATRVCVEHENIFCEDCRDAKHQYCSEVRDVAEIIAGKVELSKQNTGDCEFSKMRRLANEEQGLETMRGEVTEALSELEKLTQRLEKSIDQTKAIIDVAFNQLATTFREEIRELKTESEAVITKAKDVLEFKMSRIEKFKSVFDAVESADNKDCKEILRYYYNQKQDEIVPENDKAFNDMFEGVFEDGTPLKTLADRGGMLEEVMEHLPKLEDMTNLTARAVMHEEGRELRIELKDHDTIFMTVVVNEKFFRN